MLYTLPNLFTIFNKINSFCEKHTISLEIASFSLHNVGNHHPFNHCNLALQWHAVKIPQILKISKFLMYLRRRIFSQSILGFLMICTNHQRIERLSVHQDFLFERIPIHCPSILSPSESRDSRLSKNDRIYRPILYNKKFAPY